MFNNAGTIADTLSSVAGQSCPPAEVIVVDDGSSDGSADVVRSFHNQLPQLTYIPQPNAGVAVARNRGVKEARSPWVAFLDADDIWFPQHLEALAHAHITEPAAHLIGTRYVETASVDEVRRSHPSSGVIDISKVGVRQVEYFNAVAQNRSPFFTSSIMLEKEAFLSVGGFPEGERRGEDLALWARLAQHNRVAASDYTGAIYRRGQSSSATSRTLDQADVAIRTYLELADEPGARADASELRREAAYRLALAHALDAMIAGRADIASDVFLPIAAPTQLNWKRFLVVKSLATLPASITSRLVGSWLALKHRRAV
jgi:glycosyltransferase involved in cell wall biosynthesis